MILRETAPPAHVPVPLGEFAAHLRLAEGFDNDGAEDALLELYLRTATATVESRLARALIRRGFRLEVAAWDRHGHLTLPVGPVAAIDALAFLGGAAPESADVGALVLEPGETRQRLTGRGGGPLPPIPPGRRAELAFEAGHGSGWNDVPEDLRQAVLFLAAHYFENRANEAEPDAGLPAGVLSLLAPHAPVRL